MFNMRQIIGAAAFIAAMAAVSDRAEAVLIDVADGSLSTVDGTLITLPDGTGIDLWDGSTLTWDVDFEDTTSQFVYTYDFTVPQRGISHLVIEVSADFNTLAGFCSLDGTAGDDIANCVSSAATDPTSATNQDGLGGSSLLFGLKLDDISDPTDVFSVTYTLTTDVGPVWGDFYSKDGNVDMGTLTIEAFNSGYTSADPGCAVVSGNADNTGDCAFGFLAVPDSVPVPEPSTLGLLGAGLLGLWFRRKAT